MVENKYTILFILPDGSWKELNRNIFNDLYIDARVTVLESRLPPLHNLLCAVRRIHYSKAINRIVNLPLKEIWKNSLDNINFERSKKYVLIFLDSVYPITVKYIKEIKNNFDVTCVLFLLNTATKQYMEFIEPYISYMNYIFSFDYTDAQKYGYIECTSLYSKMDVADNNHILQDIYYIGYNKGRLKTIQRIVSLAKKDDVKLLVRVNGVDEDIDNIHSNIIYNQKISYTESVIEMLECNCILELLSEGQSGSTLRYYEAVCYNKKLLTNNKNVVNLPFYNPDYIHVFEKPEDIDWDWVKERIPVDYHYDGRFSPTHLIDRIIELEEEKESRQNVEKEIS